jgi:hypothetical protein
VRNHFVFQHSIVNTVQYVELSQNLKIFKLTRLSVVVNVDPVWGDRTF